MTQISGGLDYAFTLRVISTGKNCDRETLRLIDSTAAPAANLLTLLTITPPRDCCGNGFLGRPRTGKNIM